MAAYPSSPDIKFIYGTAWKQEQTAELVEQALRNGFRAIDVAAQERHYRELGAGDGVRAAIRAGIVDRSQIVIQTKFTWTSSQDPGTEPFDVNAQVPTQVSQSIQKSLSNLCASLDNDSEAYIDTLLLHFPLPTLVQTLQAWTTMEAYVPDKIRRLGICNTTLPIVQVLCKAKSVTVRPSIVQNQFHAKTGYDIELRKYCSENGIQYQGFGVLKSNKDLLESEVVRNFACLTGVTAEAALFFLIFNLGDFSILNGTRNEATMLKDLEDAKKLNRWASQPRNAVVLNTEYMPQFSQLLARS